MIALSNYPIRNRYMIFETNQVRGQFEIYNEIYIIYESYARYF